MGWIYVVLAAISEISGTMGLKMYSQKKTWKSGSLYLGGFGASFVFLYAAFHYIQVSIAYAVWIGIGTAGAVLVNMVFFGEPKSRARLISVGLIIIGVTGLKVVS
ncbi:QacE family quaternary ammonium compound efflux SMR transporter [Bacillus sp. J14TS2]|uniref:DMT family transporter n=1 Tax=Bacillus sp. J14TS2 TaxID=2807188 RepID=UPI001B09D3FA|nr:multidrug efflux SMR transporter [Bacillus sp. J14TS2]GIN71998.1 QacE family quaternary ammonium compound efflux SMR transporter [Bacillus sp. J14TS2]